MPRERQGDIGIEVRKEPFTEKQKRQSRMDGGEEEDETKRDFVEVAPPVVQPYVEREIQLAIASNRHPREGSAAYRDVPLTGAFQSSFPAYRHSTFFGELGDAAQLTNAESRVASRRLQDIFSRNDEGQIVGVFLAQW